MKTITTFAILLATTLGAHAQTFTARTIVLHGDTPAVFRGVINTVYLPVPDDFELGPVQSGYFLFTSDDYTITIKDDSGETTQVKNQQMFQLTPSEEQTKQFESILGKPVEVKARLMPRQTRYHRTPILLEVLSFKIIKS